MSGTIKSLKSCKVVNYLEKKIEILQVYKNEIGISPFPRSIEAVKGLAAYRAATCNCKYAEAFKILKEIG